MKTNTALAAFLLAAWAGVTPLSAEGPYRNRDNKNPNDPGEGTYPVPYQLPTVPEITEQLTRIRAYLEVAAPARVIDTRTGAEITDFAQPVATAVTDRGEGGDFDILGYTNGVTLSAMLRVADVTGERGFADFAARRLQFISDRLPYFRAQQGQFQLDRRNSFRGLLKPEALDDCGAMCAALIRARLAGVGPDLMPSIRLWTDYIARGQFRLEDGTLARQRPQARSLWADDAYMSIPALAEMGRLTGERAWFDDAVKNALQMSQRLFDRDLQARLARQQPRCPAVALGPSQRLGRAGAL
jgi:unsaturated rhamnogalacturonyl hydrolase